MVARNCVLAWLADSARCLASTSAACTCLSAVTSLTRQKTTGSPRGSWAWCGPPPIARPQRQLTRALLHAPGHGLLEPGSITAHPLPGQRIGQQQAAIAAPHQRQAHGCRVQQLSAERVTGGAGPCPAPGRSRHAASQPAHAPYKCSHEDKSQRHGPQQQPGVGPDQLPHGLPALCKPCGVVHGFAQQQRFGKAPAHMHQRIQRHEVVLRCAGAPRPCQTGLGMDGRAGRAHGSVQQQEIPVHEKQLHVPTGTCARLRDGGAGAASSLPLCKAQASMAMIASANTVQSRSDAIQSRSAMDGHHPCRVEREENRRS